MNGEWEMNRLRTILCLALLVAANAFSQPIEDSNKAKIRTDLEQSSTISNEQIQKQIDSAVNQLAKDADNKPVVQPNIKRKQSQAIKLKGLSCTEVSTAIKHSRCAGGIGSMLHGANVVIGVSIPGNSVTVKDKSKQIVAKLVNENIPSPVISLVLKPTFFKNILRSDMNLLGWGVGLTYSNILTNKQEIRRTRITYTENLGTYMSGRVLAGSPHVFYQYGPESSQKYFRFGLGMAIGYFALDGFFFETDDVDQPQCYNAVTDYVLDQQNRSHVEQNCSRVRASESIWGVGGYSFLSARYNRWSLELNIAGNEFNLPGERTLSPSFVNIIASYHIDF